MENGVPEWLVCIGMIIVFVQGFLTAGIMFLPGPFWDGVRDVYSFGFRYWKKK